MAHTQAPKPIIMQVIKPNNCTWTFFKGVIQASALRTESVYIRGVIRRYPPRRSGQRPAPLCLLGEMDISVATRWRCLPKRVGSGLGAALDLGKCPSVHLNVNGTERTILGDASASFIQENAPQMWSERTPRLTLRSQEGGGGVWRRPWGPSPACWPAPPPPAPGQPSPNPSPLGVSPAVSQPWLCPVTVPTFPSRKKLY